MKNNGCVFVSSPLKDFSFGYDYANPKCIALKLQLAQYINDMYKAGVRDFYSLCEEGPELWAAKIVTYIMKSDRSVRLFCVLPYEEQAAKWHPDTRELYYNVLEQATEITMISVKYTDDCYDKAIYAALDNCENVFAVVKEGRKNVFVRYAKVRGKNIQVM